MTTLSSPGPRCAKVDIRRERKEPMSNKGNQRHFRRLLHPKGRTLLPRIASLCALCVVPALGQNSASQQSPQSASQTSGPAPTAVWNHPVPAPAAPAEWDDRMVPMTHTIMYQTFFNWTRHQAVAAAEGETEGQDGSWLRKHLQANIGLSPAQADLVQQTAIHDYEAVSAIHAKLVAAIKAQLANSPAQPQWAELEEIYKQETAATMQDVADLEEKLGPDASATFKAYMEKHWHDAVQRNGLLSNSENYSPVHELWQAEKVRQAMADYIKLKNQKPALSGSHQETQPEVKQ